MVRNNQEFTSKATVNLLKLKGKIPHFRTPYLIKIQVSEQNSETFIFLADNNGR